MISQRIEHAPGGALINESDSDDLTQSDNRTKSLCMRLRSHLVRRTAPFRRFVASSDCSKTGNRDDNDDDKLNII